MSNAEIERAAFEYVMGLERQAFRQPEDVRLQGFPYDVSSPPRKIEVKAFGGSARGAPIPLEDRQVKAAREDPQNFYVYVVDNIATGDQAKIAVRVLHGRILAKCSIGPYRTLLTGRRFAPATTTRSPKASIDHQTDG